MGSEYEPLFNIDGLIQSQQIIWKQGNTTKDTNKASVLLFKSVLISFSQKTHLKSYRTIRDFITNKCKLE